MSNTALLLNAIAVTTIILTVRGLFRIRRIASLQKGKTALLFAALVFGFVLLFVSGSR